MVGPWAAEPGDRPESPGVVDSSGRFRHSSDKLLATRLVQTVEFSGQLMQMVFECP